MKSPASAFISGTVVSVVIAVCLVCNVEAGRAYRCMSHLSAQLHLAAWVNYMEP